MEKAEKKCRKLHMGAVEWSPQIQKVRTTIYYLKLCLRRKKQVRVSARLLKRQSRKANIYCMDMKEDELIALLDIHFKKWKRLKKRAKKLPSLAFFPIIYSLYLLKQKGPCKRMWQFEVL